MATGGGGWSHSGPWPYLQEVPLLFYGPGVVRRPGTYDRPVTLADVAPTIATLLRGSFQTGDGRSLGEVARLSGRLLGAPRPRLIVTVVWDGGGWNALRRWPDSWPNLSRLMRQGVAYTGATVGSSPSVTPAVHTTLGTGTFPWVHGITDVPARDETGEVVDVFLRGDSSRFLQVPAIAERWDEQNRNRPVIGMVGYEPWHLGMIGMGAERPGGDRDHAVWLNTETNEWITNPDHYELPAAVADTGGLDLDLEALDAADGAVDGAWRDNEILDQRDRWEETPAFIAYHARAMRNLIKDEGYGKDAVTDLLFTNFKQIDRVGHYFNMASEEVKDAIEATDDELGNLVSFLDLEVGAGKWLLIVTADHGQQPSAPAVGGYGIDPNEIERDIDAEFGPVTRAVWPTQAFLLDDQMRPRDVTAADVAHFLSDYRLEDNAPSDDDVEVARDGGLEPDARLFAAAVPAALLPEADCAAP